MTVNKPKKDQKDSNNPITKLSLAFVDEPIPNPESGEDIEEGGDPYESKLGGRPAWLNEKNIPISEITCQICQTPQVFLMQLFAPLPPKNLDRNLYLFCCKNSTCTKQAEGFTVIRVHNKIQRRNLKNSKVKKGIEEDKKEEGQKSLFGTNSNTQNNFMLGNIWGSSTSNNGSGGGLFGSSGNATNNSPFSAPSGLFGSNNTQPKEKEEAKEDDLVNKLDQLNIDEDGECSEEEEELETLAWPTDLPYYTPYYLAFDEEINESDAPIDLSKYKKYEELIKSQTQQSTSTNEEGGVNWDGEGYEKTPLPHGMDKTFEHFGNIIQYYPDQCLRYQFNGNPLLYHNQDDISRKILKVSGKKQQAKMKFDNIKHCEKCGSERTFELQLMPQLLSYLSLNSNSSSSNKGEELNLQLKGQNFLDQFDLGLEFGTVLVFSCKNDCNLKDGHAFAKELAYPQHQL